MRLQLQWLVGVLLLGQCVLWSGLTRGQSTTQCKGTANTLPVWSGTPTLVSKVENGSLYVAGDGDDKINVLHVYGSPYEMGFAHGKLLAPQVQAVLKGYMEYAESQIEEYLKKLPKKMADWIADVGLDAALDATEVMTKPFSPQYFFDEMRGLADGAGVDYRQVVRVHMLPELIKAQCSMMGAWGSAMATPAGMVQLRALDFGTDSILQDYPVVTVYHPIMGHTFANVGWAGWITSIAGMSSTKMAVSEKVSDIPFGAESRSGVPFNFLMRDILQFDNSIQQSMSRVMNAHRTCSIWLGVGNGDQKDFRIFQYSASTAKVFTDKNVTMINQTRFEREHCDQQCYEHYTAPDLLYWGVHLGCWNEVLMENKGKISPEVVIAMGGQVQTGDLLSCVYDLEGLQLYVSNARGSKETGSLDAYDRQFLKLDMATLFNLPRPQL